MITLYLIGSADEAPLLLARGYKFTADPLLAQGCALMPGWSQSAEAIAEAMEAYEAAFRTGIPCRPLKEWL